MTLLKDFIDGKRNFFNFLEKLMGRSLSQDNHKKPKNLKKRVFFDKNRILKNFLEVIRRYKKKFVD